MFGICCKCVGNMVKYTEKSDNAVDFEVCGAINNDSTIEDIVDELGNPSSIMAYESKYESYIIFKYESKDDNGWLEFRLSDDGKKIVKYKKLFYKQIIIETLLLNMF